MWALCLFCYLSVRERGLMPGCPLITYRYARLIAHYPYVIILSLLCVAVVCLVLSVTVVPLPNFQDPRAVSIKLYMSEPGC